MEVLLDKIIKECESRNIRTRFDEETCKYFISNIIKDYDLELYTTDDAVVFENNYGDTEDVLSFRDMVDVVHFWRMTYKDCEPWESVTTDWSLIFKEFLVSSELIEMLKEDDELPF